MGRVEIRPGYIVHRPSRDLYVTLIASILLVAIVVGGLAVIVQVTGAA